VGASSSVSTTDGLVRVDDSTTEGAEMVDGSATDGIPCVDPTGFRKSDPAAYWGKWIVSDRVMSE